MNDHDFLRQGLLQLRAPVNDQDALLQLLSTCLKALGLYNDHGVSSNDEPLNSKVLLRYIPEYQTALLENVIPHWEEHLRENGNINMVIEYFAPPTRINGTARMESILSAYSILTSHLTLQLSVDILATLSRETTPFGVFQYLLGTADRSPSIDAAQRWSDFLKSMFSIPGRAANATESGRVVIPEELEIGIFLATACRSWISLISHDSYNPSDETQREAASLFLGKLVTLGCFPPQPPLVPSNPSFWSIKLSERPGETFFRLDIPVPDGKIVNMPSGGTNFSKMFLSAVALLPISQQLAIVTSLLSQLDSTLRRPNISSIISLEHDDLARSKVKEASLVLQNTLGGMINPSNLPEHKKRYPGQDDQLPIWPVISALLDKSFSEGTARSLVCWAAQSDAPDGALEYLLNRSLDIWSNLDHIRHSTLQRHRAVTCLLLTTIAQIQPLHHGDPKEHSKPVSSAIMKRLATKGTFITAVGAYIEHAEPSVRLCGMFTAELVAKMVGSKLQFPGWEDDGNGQAWARRMQSFLQGRDSDAANVSPSDPPNDKEPVELSRVANASHGEDAESHPSVHRVTIHEEEADSDDSLEGYASSSSSSSRSSSHAASHPPLEARSKADVSSNLRPTVEEINADPTLLNPLKKKIQKPVYLLDLGRLLKVDKEGNEQFESIQTALNTAAPLIRKKSSWGLELEENAVDLTHSLIGLQNNYDLDEFEQRVLEALTALVACSPRKVASCIIEHFFTPSYSTSQRYTMLNALALGARELAGLPTPQIPQPKPSFPSKILPAASHRKYYTTADESDAGAQIRGLVGNISTKAINSGVEDAEEHVPEIVRERQLTVRLNRGGRAGGIVELQTPTGTRPVPSNSKGANTFNQVAAEYFILPLIAKFWDYLQDTLARQEWSVRTSRNGEGGFTPAGTAMITSPLVLSHLINTVSIMVHASRHSPAFLSIVAPAALELAVTLGTRKVGSEARSPNLPGTSGPDEDSKRAASILSASLELAIVVLDASIALDSGKTLALEHGSLVSGTTLWARKAFGMLDAGLQLEGMGGEEEVRLRGASAGLLLKVEEITRKWSQAMF